jgi:hypothetical protein
MGRVIAREDFTSLDAALAAAEQRRATLQAELARLDGSQQPPVVHLTSAMLEGNLQGMTEKLHSNGGWRWRNNLRMTPR